MNHSTPRRMLAASFLLVGLLAVAGLSLASAPVAQAPTLEAAPTDAQTTDDAVADDAATPGSTLIVARNFEFVPADAVTLDDWVTFVNAGPSTHRPIADDACFDAGFMGVGTTSTVSVASCPDIIPYHCSIHPSMTGTIEKL